MSYTATTTRGIAPTNLNLNIFSHPSRAVHKPTQSHMVDIKSVKTPSAVLTDDEDIFSLDMVTMDMNFDQAYLMYTLMQHKNAMMGIEQLEAAQQVNLNNTFAMQQNGGAGSHHLNHNVLESGGLLNSTGAGAHGIYLFGVPDELMNGGGLFSGIESATPVAQSAFEKDANDMDQFFSNTESDALERFLDRLALLNPLESLEMYQQAQPKMSPMFELHTIGPMEQASVQREITDLVKKEITDAFKHPPVQSLKSFGTNPSQTNNQLPTPLDSCRSSTCTSSKRVDEDVLPPMSPLQKRRKVSRPLLSLEQKRLNHSNNEHKRRLLCKAAYERCLRLITNVDDYKNQLVSASAVTSSKKKSKRRQINKDGLPNLSKHTALCKISEEIEKISEKNKQLRKLLGIGKG